MKSDDTILRWPMVVEGDLTLKTLNYDDVADVKRWLKDRTLAKYAFGLRLELGDEDVDSVVEDYLFSMANNIDRHISIIAQGKHIGVLFYRTREINGENLAIIGILLGPKEYRGRGYGTRALKVMIDRLFNMYRCSSIELDTAQYNVVAQRVYTKLGFQRCTGHRIYDGLELIENETSAPCFYFSMHRDRWLNFKAEPSK